MYRRWRSQPRAAVIRWPYSIKFAKSKVTCVRLLDAGRVDFIAPADYRAASKLTKRVHLLLDSVIAGIAYQAEVATCKAENS